MLSRTTLNQAIQGFPKYIDLRGSTKSTENAYMGDLKQFNAFINNRYKNLVYADSLCKFHVADYMAYLKESKKYKRTTIDRKLDSLIVFFSYLKDMNYKEENIFKDFSYKRVKLRYMADSDSDFKPYIFSDSELKNLIEEIQKSNDINKFRDLAIMLMLIELGIRRSTLLVSRWEDVLFREKEFTLHHVKDQITITVPISDNLVTALLTYQFISGRKTGRIFFSNKNHPLSESAFNDLIRKHLMAVGAYQKGATSHSFRHTFVVRALRQNISPYKIIKFTGHRDISSLKPYENLLAKDLEDVTVTVCLPFDLKINKKS